jgi:hypothetical protein
MKKVVVSESSRELIFRIKACLVYTLNFYGQNILRSIGIRQCEDLFLSETVIASNSMFFYNTGLSYTILDYYYSDFKVCYFRVDLALEIVII